MKKYCILLVIMLLLGSINIPVFAFNADDILLQESDFTIEKIENQELENLLKNNENNLQNDKNNAEDADIKNSDKKYKSIQVKLDGLNYYKPVYFKPIAEEQYSVVLFDKLYDYGEVRLLIVPHYNGETANELKKEVIFDDVLKSDEETSIILENNKEYLSNIFISDAKGIVIAHYGKITVNNGNVEYSVEYISDIDTIQTESMNRTTVLTHSIYEQEPNNSKEQANIIYSNRDVYGRIGSSTDEDYYKITFTSSGQANFWLGDIYKNCDYDLYVYNSAGNQLWSSANSGQSQELITQNVTNTTYYVKVKPYSTNFNWEYYYFLRVRLLSDNSTGTSWPTISTTINACFECQPYYDKYGIVHGGVDVEGTNANPIVAIASGKVTKAGEYTGNGMETYGKVVFIEHDINNPNSIGANDKFFQSRYAHMCEVLVTEGQNVGRGKILGYIGNTGQSYGEHLHYEIRIGASSTSSLTKINPLTFYSKNWICTYCNQACGRSSHNPENLNKILSEYNGEMNMQIFEKLNDRMDVVEVLINNEYILDLEALAQMPEQELGKYGIDKKIINIVIKNIQKLEKSSKDETNNYINILNKKFE